MVVLSLSKLALGNFVGRSGAGSYSGKWQTRFENRDGYPENVCSWNWNSKHVNWTCVDDFIGKVGHGKGLFQVDAAFAHNRTKAITTRGFKELLVTVYSQ